MGARHRTPPNSGTRPPNSRLWELGGKQVPLIYRSRDHKGYSEEDKNELK